MPSWLTIDALALAGAAASGGLIAWEQFGAKLWRKWRSGRTTAEPDWRTVLAHYEGLYEALPCEEACDKLRAVWPYLQQVVCDVEGEGDDA